MRLTQHITARLTWRSGVSLLLLALSAHTATGQSPSAPALLASRAELTNALARAEAQATSGDPAQRAQSALVASGIRHRLKDGDFQVGDRVVVRIAAATVQTDTVIVRAGRVIELQGMIVVPVTGVLRSELSERVSSEVMKYVKAQQVEVTPLTRVGVLGAVSRPGYFAFASDTPLTDAIMSAGGPTETADVQRSVVRRRNQQYRSAEETRKAIARGLTLDQFGLDAGDELVIGERRGFGMSSMVAATGAVASVLALFVTLRR